jgi:hypothetical protein
MDTFICILKSLGVWIVLLFLSTNLLGMVFRGVYPTYKKDESGNLIMTENPKTNTNKIITIISIILCLIYLYLLFHYMGVTTSLCGFLLMITRIPDLLKEMRTGEKTTLRNIDNRPIHLILSFVRISTIVILFYSFC